MFITNAIIKSAEITNDYHGVLSAWLYLDFGGSGQGFGGSVLYLPKNFKHHQIDCGYAGGDVKCHQVCIEYDARRKLYGAMLVVAMETYANASLSNSITLRCGFDLEANKFWQELGYNCIAVKQGGIRRMRKINVWRKYLQPQMFEPVWVEPVEGKIDASIWRKHKNTGIVTQFDRGKKLENYRLKLISKI